MKGIYLLSFIALLGLSVSCADPEPVATGYKKKVGTGNAQQPAGNGGQQQQQPAGNGGQQQQPPVGNGDAQGENGGGEEEPAGGGGGGGDAAKGAALLTEANCKQCHVAAGLGKKALSPEYVDLLDNAAPGGKHAGVHGGFADTVFAPANRADVEAALKAL